MERRRRLPALDRRGAVRRAAPHVAVSRVGAEVRVRRGAPHRDALDEQPPVPGRGQRDRDRGQGRHVVRNGRREPGREHAHARPPRPHARRARQQRHAAGARTAVRRRHEALRPLARALLERRVPRQPAAARHVWLARRRHDRVEPHRSVPLRERQRSVVVVVRRAARRRVPQARVPSEQVRQAAAGGRAGLELHLRHRLPAAVVP
mmetsp:Transcript_32476/g.100489  ORF Transcript_32476/g.100489 Transcript_32476/m.100489 type:complete len:206 (+) Transcript_32476:506-1123(+)